MTARSWDKRVLDYGPFDGDRDVDVRVLRDKIVIARKGGVCNYCWQLTIKPKDRIRARTETCDGRIATFRICNLCCNAMAKAPTDHGAAVEARIALAMQGNSP